MRKLKILLESENILGIITKRRSGRELG